MRRSTFLKRMAFVAVASAFVNVERLLPAVAPAWSLAVAIERARPGDVIVLPPGDHYIDSPIIIPSGVTLDGRGSATLRGQPGCLVVPPTSRSITFSGLHFA